MVPHTLYFLYHGKLHIRTPDHALEPGRKSPGGGKVQRPLRFRPVENPGDMLGLYDPFDIKSRVAFEIYGQVTQVIKSRVRRPSYSQGHECHVSICATVNASMHHPPRVR